MFRIPGIRFLMGMGSILNGNTAYLDYLKSLNLEADNTILDVGTAYGSIFFATKKYEGLNLIAMDSDPLMVGHSYVASKLMRILGNRNNMQVLKSDSEYINLPDDSVDFAIDSNCLMYSRDLKTVLSELRRVVKPDGQIISTTHFDRDDFSDCARSVGFSYSLVYGQKDFVVMQNS